MPHAAPKESPTCPAVTVTSPEIMFIVVLFPAPLVPNRPNTSPGTNGQELLIIITVNKTFSPVCWAISKSTVGERLVHKLISIN